VIHLIREAEPVYRGDPVKRHSLHVATGLPKG